VISVLALTFAVGFVSSFYPGLPVEPYLIAMMATTNHNAILVGAVAGAGQSTGKMGIFLATRGAVRLPALRRWIERRRAEQAAAEEKGEPVRWWSRWAKRLSEWARRMMPLDRPMLAAPVILLSAFIGIPPLLLMTFAAAATRMRSWVFLTVCLIGRCARLIAVSLTPAAAGFFVT
jgi:membrane protein YqaA with SNARE-associated domain